MSQVPGAAFYVLPDEIDEYKYVVLNKTWTKVWKIIIGMSAVWLGQLSNRRKNQRTTKQCTKRNRYAETVATSNTRFVSSSSFLRDLFAESSILDPKRLTKVSLYLSKHESCFIIIFYYSLINHVFGVLQSP